MANTRALIRLDSSVRLGTGHLMRCLSLAEELRRRQVAVSFACRVLPGHMSGLAAARGFGVCALHGEDSRDDTESLLPDWERDAAETAAIVGERCPTDWLIVDHYGLDDRWEHRLRGSTQKILVIDDLANRRHACDLLLDQNYFADAQTRYAGLVAENTQTLLGPRYALLRPEFEAFRREAKPRDGTVKRLLIFFGGTDPDNATEKAVRAVQRTRNEALKFDVVVGGSNPNRSSIEVLCATDPRCHYHCQAENMAELMLRADLALGAGGATTWERCFLGLPAIIVATATNQIQTNVDLAALGICWFLGRARDVEETQLAACVGKALSSPSALSSMSAKAMRVTGDDDLLPTRRLAQIMLSDEAGLGAERRARGALVRDP